MTFVLLLIKYISCVNRYMAIVLARDMMYDYFPIACDMSIVLARGMMYTVQYNMSIILALYMMYSIVTTPDI